MLIVSTIVAIVTKKRKDEDEKWRQNVNEKTEKEVLRVILIENVRWHSCDKYAWTITVYSGLISNDVKEMEKNKTKMPAFLLMQLTRNIFYIVCMNLE